MSERELVELVHDLLSPAQKRGELLELLLEETVDGVCHDLVVVTSEGTFAVDVKQLLKVRPGLELEAVA